MVRFRLHGVLFALFLLGGALGGWWFLSERAVSTAHAQVGAVCGPGRDCKARSIQTGIPTAQLGTCNGNRAGMLAYDTTLNAYYFCNGSAWGAVDTAGGGGDGIGECSDAGVCPVAYIVATSADAGYVLSFPVGTGGTGEGAIIGTPSTYIQFDDLLPVVTPNLSVNGSFYATDVTTTGIGSVGTTLNVGGAASAPEYVAITADGGVAFALNATGAGVGRQSNRLDFHDRAMVSDAGLVLQSVNGTLHAAMVMANVVDAGTVVGTTLGSFGAVNSTGTVTANVGTGTGFACGNGACYYDLSTGTNDTIRLSGSYINIGAAGTNYIGAGGMLASGTNTLQLGGSAATSVLVGSNGAVTAANPLVEFGGNATVGGGLGKAWVYGDGAFRSLGVATGSLRTCAAGIAGSIIYDTTTTTLKSCDGTAWREVKDAESFGAYSPINAEEQAFGAHVAARGGTAGEPRFTVTSAGASGGSNAVLELYDTSGAAQRCTLTFDCATAAGTVVTGTVSCAAPTVVEGNTLVWQWDSSSACSTLPMGNAEVAWEG